MDELEGWTIDTDGTITTPSGYRTSAQVIECALWLFGALRITEEKKIMYADTAAGGRRPFYEPADCKERSAGQEARPRRNAGTRTLRLPLARR